MAINKMLGEALRLADLGLRVFPLNGKSPIGGHGCLDATNDPLQIESWWERYPKANIGLATGKGIAVVDVDVRRDGGHTLKELVNGKKWPKTVKAKSGGGGWHFFFGVPPNMREEVENSTDRLGKGIEIIHDGRYVVAPPSIHPTTGNSYEWVRPPDSDDWQPIPEWLVQLNKTARRSWDPNVEEIKEHEGRNNYLTSFAGSLRARGSTTGEIYDALIARNERICKPPLSTRDVMRIAKSVGRYPPNDPMIIARCNDIGNGERFARHAKGNAIFVPGIGWHVWSGVKWERDRGQIQEIAKETATEIFRAAADCKDDEWQKKLMGWAHQSCNKSRVDSMTAMASTRADIVVDPAKLDQVVYRVNLRNGTYDLKEGELVEHKRGDLLTKRANVTYDPEATADRWEQFMEEILPDAEVRAYVQRAVGYSLTGDVSEQCFFLMYGVGSNGKSTFVEAIRSMLGSYASKMGTATIMSGHRQAGSASPDIVRLRGPRFVVAAESGDDSCINETVIKDLTGKDTLTARGLYEKNEVEFIPQFKLWVYANYKPIVRGRDYGIWRRIRLIPFTATIENPDLNMLEHLKRERAGMFNWALRGYREWEKYGLNEPQAILDEVKEYQEMMDVVQQFIEEKCQVGRELMEPAAELWETFAEWQKDVPYSERMRRGRFFERLRAVGFRHARAKPPGGKHPISQWRGLRLV